MRSVTNRQRMFVESYLGESAGCAVDAARRAGDSSPHPEGARLLMKAPKPPAIAVNAIQIPSTESPHEHQEKSAFGLANRTWLESMYRMYGRCSLWVGSHIGWAPSGTYRTTRPLSTSSGSAATSRTTWRAAASGRRSPTPAKASRNTPTRSSTCLLRPAGSCAICWMRPTSSTRRRRHAWSRVRCNRGRSPLALARTTSGWSMSCDH
jgi:hypothetical protein